MKLLKKGEPVVSESIAPLEKSGAEKILNEHRRKGILRAIDLSKKQLYGIFERADSQYLYDELNDGRIIRGLEPVLNRSDAEVQTALYFIERFHRHRHNKTDHSINISMEDDSKDPNTVALRLNHSGMSNESMFIQLYKERPAPATMPADLNKKLRDLIQNPQYTEYEGYRYHHTKQKSMGQRYSNYTIITDTQNKIVAIAGSSSVVFFDAKRPTLSFTGRSAHDEFVEHKVTSYSHSNSHFSDATGNPEGFFETIREYLAK